MKLKMRCEESRFRIGRCLLDEVVEFDEIDLRLAHVPQPCAVSRGVVFYLAFNKSRT